MRSNSKSTHSSRWRPGLILSALALVGIVRIAAAAAPPVQFFYAPFPEDQLLAGLQAIESGGPDVDPVAPMQTYISLAAIADGTIIYYDHWEDGYEADIDAPTQSTTKIWGDGNSANGFPPGVPSDLINAGTVVVMNNPVPLPRNPTEILFDGRDKIAASKTISMTKTGWASGSNTLLAGSVEMFDTDNWGIDYIVPVGEDIPSSTGYEMFEYTGLVILARDDATTINIDADANGVFETSLVLAEGQSHQVNGGVSVGARVTSDKPVQVDLLTGDIASSYESRDTALLPTNLWTGSYYTPVSTTSDGGGIGIPSTAVWLYNPAASAITVAYQYRSGGIVQSSSTSVPAGSYTKVILNNGTGYHFFTDGGQPFYAFSTTDSGSSFAGNNQTWDWSYSLVPDDSLTSQTQIALGIGRDPTSAVNPDENGNPVWVTPVGIGDNTTAVTVYVDYNGDGVGGSTDINNNQYDATVSLRELEHATLYDPDGDQTGMIVYVLPGENGTPLTTKLAVAWGQDPSVASGRTPGIDVGTGTPPVPLFEAGKSAVLVDDADQDGFISPGDTIEYDVRIVNVSRAPVPNLVLTDMLPPEVSYLPGTTKFKQTPAGSFVPVADDLSGTPFPLDEAGYAIAPSLPVRGEFQLVFRSTIKAFAQLNGASAIINTGTVRDSTTEAAIRDVQPIYGALGDLVWNDINGNGQKDVDEPGLGNVPVYIDANGNNAYDPGERADLTDTNGIYAFGGLPAGTYVVRVVTTTLPPGAIQTYDLNGALDNEAEVLLAGGQNRTDVDYGYQIPAPALLLDKSTTTLNYDNVGDTISYSYLVTNSGNVPVTTPYAVTDDKATVTCPQTPTSLNPGASLTCTASYAVTQADLTAGAVVNTATASAVFNGNPVVSNQDQVSVPAIQGPALLLDKSTTTPNYDAVGDTISYSYLVTNSGNVPVVPTYAVIDDKATVTCPQTPTPLNPGASLTCTASYVVTQADLNAGAVLNTATASAVFNGNTVVSNQDQVSVPAAQGPALTLDKSTTTPNYDAVGDTISYSYLVTNSGNVPVTTPYAVTDDKATVTCPQTPTPLDPGASITCTASYVVTQADLNAGAVLNTATASAVFNGNTVISNEDKVTVPTAKLGSVGDILYYDIDGDGVQGLDEPGVPGVTLTLTPPIGVDLGNGPGVAITGQTGPNGEYLFTGLPAGGYSVTVETGSGSPVNGFINSGDPDGGNDSTVVVTLTEGENNLSQDFGYEGLDLGDAPDSYLTLLANGGPSHFAIGPTLGTVRDLDANGQPTVGADGDDTNGAPNDEDGVSGGLSFTEGDDAVVTIGYVKPGTAPATVCGWMDLDDNGSFEASELVTGTAASASGTVTLSFGAVPTTGAARDTYARLRISTGGDPSDCAPSGFVANGEVEDYLVAIRAQAPGSIGDTIYYDLNGNGQQDTGEPGVPGVTVTLGGDTTDTAISGPDGKYLFNDLPAGNYTVTVDTSSGSPVNSFTNTADPDGGFNSTSTVELAAGEDNLDQNFGYEGLDLGDAPDGYETLLGTGGPPHFASGPYFGAARDVETDGQPTAAANGDDLIGVADDEDGLIGSLAFTEGANASVTLSYNNPIGGSTAQVCGWLDLDGNGAFNANELESAIVNPGAGSVTLDFGTVPAAGNRTSYARFRIGTPATTACNPGGFVPNGEVEDYVVDITEQPLGSIGDTIYFDYNGNGQQDPGEPGVPGVTVTLGGDLDNTAVTGPNGEYLFTGLPAGSYTVSVDTGTGPFAGFTNTGDPDGGNNSMSAVTLGVGEDMLAQDFGYRGLDLGDAPNRYATLLAANGPSHFAVGPTLGSVRDMEANGQPGATATGDDLAGLSDDEDAVASPLAFTSGTNASVTLAYVNPGSGDATLCGWLDLNGTGGFEVSELRVQTVPPGSSTVALNFGTVSGGARSTYARFRIASASGCAPVSFATDGEVEDHKVTIAAAGKTPKIDIRKQAEGPDTRTFAPGATVTFSIQVFNRGTVPLTGVTVTDPLLASCARSIGSLAVGQSRTFSCSTVLKDQTKLFKDTFSVTAFNNNNGTHPWAGPWVENDVAGSGPTAGNVLIGSNYKLWFDDYPNTGTQPSAHRTADLTGATSATLSFTWETNSGVDPADKVVVEVSKNGGASYRVLKSFTGFAGAKTGTESLNITGEISSQTTIRFRVDSGYGEAQETFKVDDVAINAKSPAQGFTNEACASGTGAGQQVSDCDTSTVVLKQPY